ncbi:hypothetical protein AgCh_039543 [Apium graveolens]
MVRGFPGIQEVKEVCSGCLMSKQTRKPFPSKANYTAARALELIHGDLCGPIEPAIMGGNKYFLLLVDDFSRYMWIYFLKSKDEAFVMFKRFRALVENGSEKRIKVFRTDRGGEFNSKEFTSYCEENGIERHYTAPYTLQQNGVMERRNQTIVEMAQSCLKGKKLPRELWGKAVRHSVYLLNHLPTRALSTKTPYEVWKGSKPNIDHVRVFGCIAHMKVPKVFTKKLDDRSLKVINLGREQGTKEYRFYDPTEGRIYISRDVEFEEMKGWSWDFSEVNNYEDHNYFSVPDVENSAEGDNQAEDNGENNQSGGDDQESGGDDQNAPPDSPTPLLDPKNYDDSCKPRRTRRISDIYEAFDMEDELMLMGIEEPENYSQAKGSREWR